MSSFVISARDSTGGRGASTGHRRGCAVSRLGELSLVAGAEHPPGKPRALDDRREGRVDDAVAGKARRARSSAATPARFDQHHGRAPEPLGKARREPVGGDRPVGGDAACRASASFSGSQTGIAPLGQRAPDAGERLDAARAAAAARPASCAVWCMARIAMRWATASENPSSACALRTASAKAPPPGTIDARERARRRRCSGWTQGARSRPGCRRA